MSLAPASRPPELTKYELLDEIGHGGMATVYRAKDVRLGREVAIKLIHPHLRENKEVAARFIAEARAVAKLRHPGIVEVFDVSDGEDAERFLVAELVRGPSLRKLLERERDIPAEVGACLGALLCGALAHAHEAGIVHRDVKPENVLVEVDEPHATVRVKLTDFGIAKVLDAQGVTSTGQVLGSPAHMAPEQIDGSQVDARADVFSLGVLIYECMTGALPFDGKNPAQVLRRVLDCSYAPADRKRPAVGSAWASVLARAIAKEPSDRYPNILAFQQALLSELREAGVEDVRAELYKFLSSPDGYREALTTHLVPRLVERAEAARDRGDVAQAACLLNRAVALAPDDADLLRRVTALARGERRKRFAMRFAGAIAGCGVLAALTFAVVRHVQAARQRAPATSVSDTILPKPAVASSIPEPEPTAAPIPCALARHLPAPNVKMLPILVKPSAESRERRVHITATPKAALVSIDGSTPAPVGFGIDRVLKPGQHTFAFTVDPKNQFCCESTTIVRDILPDDGSNTPQSVQGTLPLKPAQISLAGAPADGRLSCPDLRVEIGAGEVAQVSVAEVSTPHSCMVWGGGLPARQAVGVDVRAGTVNYVRWPASP